MSGAKTLTKKERLFESSKKVLRYINRTHGLDYALLERFSGGFQSGAYMLQNINGEKAVLKWNHRKSDQKPVDEAAAAIKLARGLGWPTPDWKVWGITPSGYPYHIQELVAGTHRDCVDTIVVEDALRVVHLQAGIAPVMENNWTAYDRGVVYEDTSGAFTKIAAFSETGKELIGILKQNLEPFRDVLIPDNDIVHGDFHNGNILMEGDKITGLIDAESIGRGSRFHDIAGLVTFVVLFNGEHAALEPLLAYVKEFAVPGEFEICLAAKLTQFLWILCRGPKDIGESKVLKAKELVLCTL